MAAAVVLIVAEWVASEGRDWEIWTAADSAAADLIKADSAVLILEADKASAATDSLPPVRAHSITFSACLRTKGCTISAATGNLAAIISI